MDDSVSVDSSTPLPSLPSNLLPSKHTVPSPSTPYLPTDAVPDSYFDPTPDLDLNLPLDGLTLTGDHSPPSPPSPPHHAAAGVLPDTPRSPSRRVPGGSHANARAALTADRLLLAEEQREVRVARHKLAAWARELRALEAQRRAAVAEADRRLRGTTAAEELDEAKKVLQRVESEVEERRRHAKDLDELREWERRLEEREKTLKGEEGNLAEWKRESERCQRRNAELNDVEESVMALLRDAGIPRDGRWQLAFSDWARRTREVADKASTVEASQRSLDEDRRHLETARQHIRDANESLRVRETELRARETQASRLEALEVSLSSREASLANREERLIEREERVAKAERRAEAATAEASSRQALLDTRERALTRLQADVNQQSATAEAAREEAQAVARGRDAKDRAQNVKEDELRFREQSVEVREGAVRRREQEVRRLELQRDDLSRREEQVREREERRKAEDSKYRAKYKKLLGDHKELQDTCVALQNVLDDARRETGRPPSPAPEERSTWSQSSSQSIPAPINPPRPLAKVLATSNRSPAPATPAAAPRGGKPRTPSSGSDESRQDTSGRDLVECRRALNNMAKERQLWCTQLQSLIDALRATAESEWLEHAGEARGKLQSTMDKLTKVLQDVESRQRALRTAESDDGLPKILRREEAAHDDFSSEIRRLFTQAMHLHDTLVRALSAHGQVSTQDPSVQFEDAMPSPEPFTEPQTGSRTSSAGTPGAVEFQNLRAALRSVSEMSHNQTLATRLDKVLSQTKASANAGKHKQHKRSVSGDSVQSVEDRRRDLQLQVHELAVEGALVSDGADRDSIRRRLLAKRSELDAIDDDLKST